MIESVSAASSPLQPPRPLEGLTYSSELTPCFPSVTSAWVFASWGLLLALFSLAAFGMAWFTLLVCAALPGLGMDDLRQTKGSLRNYPVIGQGVGHGACRCRQAT